MYPFVYKIMILNLGVECQKGNRIDEYLIILLIMIWSYVDVDDHDMIIDHVDVDDHDDLQPGCGVP